MSLADRQLHGEAVGQSIHPFLLPKVSQSAISSSWMVGPESRLGEEEGRRRRRAQD